MLTCVTVTKMKTSLTCVLKWLSYNLKLLILLFVWAFFNISHSECQCPPPRQYQQFPGLPPVAVAVAVDVASLPNACDCGCIGCAVEYCLALNDCFLACNFFCCSLRAFRSALTSALWIFSLVFRIRHQWVCLIFAHDLPSQFWRICQFQHFLTLLN